MTASTRTVGNLKEIQMKVFTPLLLCALLGMSSVSMALDVSPGDDLSVSVLLIDGEHVAFEGSERAKVDASARFVLTDPGSETRIQVTPVIRADNVIDIDVTVRQAEDRSARYSVALNEPQGAMVAKRFTVQPGEKSFVSFGNDLRYTLQVSADRELYIDQ
jgi:hypothetical protein